MREKKAEMGVGTLIIFIAMLLVAAVAAGVLIQTAGSLQEKSLATGSQAKSQISTNARVIEVSASDGRNASLTDFQEIVKLSPGSDPIKLTQIIFTFNTKDMSSTLKYRGTSGVCEKDNVNGFNTWITETVSGTITTTVNNYVLAEDLDDDGADDYMYVQVNNNVNLTDNILVNLSTAGLVTISLGADIDDAASNGTISLSNAAITVGSTIYGYLTITGDTSTNDALDSGITATVVPYRAGEGYFTVIYEQQGTNHVAGNLQRGDIIRICFEAPGNIVEDEEVRLNFIPKIGTATLTKFVTPDVISTERVYLYP